MQAAGAWYGAGFIWTMQLLNYPLLDRIDGSSFMRYEAAHNQRFAAVVAPGVLVVLGTTIALFLVRPRTLPLAVPITAAVLLLVILISTVRWQAPAHARLAAGFDSSVHSSLVQTNWIRTIAWTMLGLLDLFVLFTLFTQTSAQPRP